MAARYLRRAGLAAENLRGGLQQWVRAGLPVTLPDGRPGRVA